MKNQIAPLKSGGWLVRPTEGLWGANGASSDDAYVGIDFGTATTVASVVVPSADLTSFTVRPMQVTQPSALGGTLRNTLVNTVLSYRDGKLLFGVDAYNHRSRLQEGKNTFSSFKMGLGLNLGPEYPNSVLAEGRVPGVTVQRPADAVREFMKLLTKAITTELAGSGTKNIHYAFTVPAAFQANQRRDLLAAIKECGIATGESCLIDEPNAAFLSYIHDAARSGKKDNLIDLARTNGVNVLVFDFGAGTCDLSILEFSISAERVSSRNRAISKFTALGGDDIDREIVSKFLVDQIRDKNGELVELTTRDISGSITQRLMSAAEQLKITISKGLSESGITSLAEAIVLDDLVYETLAVPAFRLRGQEIGIERPRLSVHQFLQVMSAFCGDYDPLTSKFHVAGPINDVLDKAGMAADDLDAVLFIGGSSSSELIRSTVMDCFSPEVVAIVPPDLRIHVSQGAAIHSLGIHALGLDFIAPITSEPIQVVARGGTLETLIPVASPVPMDKPFELNLEVADNGQMQVDVPICTGARERLVGVVSIKASGNSGFTKGDSVHVVGKISKEKILDVQVTVAGEAARVEILNPLSNGTPGPGEVAMLKQKQQFNESILKNQGRPDARVVRRYSDAAAAAGAYELAADLLVALERIEPGSDYATNIGFYYSRAGRNTIGNGWYRTAYSRSKDSVTAFNLYCISSNRRDEETYLREALRHNPDYVSALHALASIVENGSPTEAAKLRGRIVDILSPNFTDTDTSIRDLDSLRSAASATARGDLEQKVSEEIRRRKRVLSTSDQVYSDSNLAAASGKLNLLAES